MREYHIMGRQVAESLAMERRITLRLLGYWEKLRGQRLMPAEKDFNPDDLKDLWDYCLLIHVHEMSRPDYHYSYMGQAISDAYCFGVPKEGEGALASLNAANLIMGCRKVIDSCKPLLDEGELSNPQQEVIKYRLCLLPLGEGDQVQAILGGMRYKLYTS